MPSIRLLAFLLIASSSPALAQSAPRLGLRAPLHAALAPTVADTPVARPNAHFRLHLLLGAATSILAHEVGHVVAAYAVGGHPSFGFDKARPTVYSGIDASREPRKQFIFSSAGLTVQNVLDELLLDVPHHRGGAFERGLLAGGIGTTLFYITLGRSGSVSDVSFMSRTSSLSKTQISLIFGGVAALHAVRIHFDRQYAHFFAAPDASGRLRVGMVVVPR